MKLIFCLYQFAVICNIYNISHNGFTVLVRSQIVCSYMDDKAMRVTFQWRLDVCHNIFCSRSGELLHYNFFIIISKLPSIISLTIELPTIAAMILSFLRSCFFLLCLKFTLFLVKILVLFGLMFFWVTLSIVIFYWYDIAQSNIIHKYV